MKSRLREVRFDRERMKLSDFIAFELSTKGIYNCERISGMSSVILYRIAKGNSITINTLAKVVRRFGLEVIGLTGNQIIVKPGRAYFGLNAEPQVFSRIKLKTSREIQKTAIEVLNENDESNYKESAVQIEELRAEEFDEEIEKGVFDNEKD